MKNQSTKKLEKDLLKLHTKDFTDTDKLTILHLILDGKIADAKDMLKPQVSGCLVNGRRYRDSFFI